MRVGISSTETDAGRAAGAGPGVRPRWPAPSSPARSRPAETYVVPAVGREAVHRRRPRPRHQGDDPAPDGRARHRGARAAGDRDARRRAGGRRRTGCSSPTVPATRRRRPARSSCSRARWPSGIPYFGICFGNQLFGRALGLRHLQAQVRPPRHQPAGHGPHHRQGRGHRAQPRVRGRRAARRADRRRRTASRRSATSASTTTWSRASSCATPTGELKAFSVQYHPEAAAGPHDAAYLFDRFVRA